MPFALHTTCNCNTRASRSASPAAFGTDVHVELVDDEAQAEDTEDDDQLAHTTDPHEYNVEHEEWKPEDDARTQ